MTKIAIFRSVQVLLLWVISSALSFWYVLVSRNAFLAVLSAWYVKDSSVRAWQLRFWDKVYFIVLGLGWLIYVFWSEAYYGDGIDSRDLYPRFARTTWPVLVLLLAVDLLLIYLQGGERSLLRWALVITEGIVGAGLALIALRSPAKSRPAPYEQRR